MTVTYLATDGTGNTETCSFDVVVEYALPQTAAVSIPNDTMQIRSGGSGHPDRFPMTAVGLPICHRNRGGLSLYNFQRVNAQTYLANFQVVEGGNSYLGTRTFR
ncbi:MAG: hypothetical protein R2751_16155 [Bacteroidales bacterium]